MKFRIEKGVSVHCRNVRGKWSIGRWSSMVTERAVEYDLEDVWYAPTDSSLTKVHRKAIGEPSDFRKRINNAYYMQNHYGFHLPKNKYNVAQIVVPRSLVEVIDDPNEKSHISEQKKLERKLKLNRGNYTFTGHPYTR